MKRIALPTETDRFINHRDHVSACDEGKSDGHIPLPDANESSVFESNFINAYLLLLS